MKNPASLRDRVEAFIEGTVSPGGLELLLQECVEDGSSDALVCVRRLYEDMYSGITHNSDLKTPAAAALVVWKEQGLRELADAAKKRPTFKNSIIAIALLASLAAGEGLPMLRTVHKPAVADAIANAIESWSGIVAYARERLADIILSIPEDDDLALRIGTVFQQFAISNSHAAKELFASISKRWLAVSTPVLNAFDELINSHANDEPKFQDFLAEHPQLLDPLAIRVWPQPDLFGFREPDYIVQRADGTYMVVEIECPAKKLVTKSNQLSAGVTHAEQQVTDYRRNLLQKHADLRIHLPNFQEPDCLVVIGLERALSDGQRQILHDANGSRTYVRIVGFDWLLERARTIASNIAQPKVDVIPLRVV